MTTPVEIPKFATRNTEQSPLLPFGESEFLAVRLLPAEFARAVGVSKQTVSRWIRDAKVTLGVDGRLDPNVAMRQLLRNGDPGRIRARLVRQAVSDVADLRAEASRAAVLERELANLHAVLADERQKADEDYEIMDCWLRKFQKTIADLPQSLRASLDHEAWAVKIKNTLSEIMDANEPGLAMDLNLVHSEHRAETGMDGL